MYDLIIKNGNMLDGTGAEGKVCDIAIKNGKIAHIGKTDCDAKTVIDAKGLTVTPGFIDSHSHSDSAIVSFPDMTEKIEQGITTSISGQCGSSVAPSITSEGAIKTFGDFIKENRDAELGSNNAIFVGHKSIRIAVMGMSKEEPTKEELEQMKELVRDAMKNGAMGISFGLIYPPSCYAKTEELLELARVVKEYDGLVAAHIRNEGDRLIEAVEEFIYIVKNSGVRGIVSHHKACGAPENHGKVVKTLKMIDDANRDGADVYFDVYPYTATHTSASVTFVPDSGSDLLKRLKNEEERQKIKEWHASKWWKDDYSWVQVARCAGYPEYEGKFVPEIAKIHGKDGCETIMDMILKSENACSCCYFTMAEEDVERVMAHPRAMICTDSGVACGRTTFHPRLKGSFPRVLGRYVREKNVVSLPEMIRKMTSMPAFVYGLKTKGLIKEGMDADICIFDDKRIIDRSDFTDCVKRAEGLEYVISGGEVVVRNAEHNGVRKAKIILRG